MKECITCIIYCTCHLIRIPTCFFKTIKHTLFPKLFVVSIQHRAYSEMIGGKFTHRYILVYTAAFLYSHFIFVLFSPLNCISGVLAIGISIFLLYSLIQTRKYFAVIKTTERGRSKTWAAVYWTDRDPTVSLCSIDVRAVSQ